MVEDAYHSHPTPTSPHPAPPRSSSACLCPALKGEGEVGVWGGSRADLIVCTSKHAVLSSSSTSGGSVRLAPLQHLMRKATYLVPSLTPSLVANKLLSVTQISSHVGWEWREKLKMEDFNQGRRRRKEGWMSYFLPFIANAGLITWRSSVAVSWRHTCTHTHTLG